MRIYLQGLTMGLAYVAPIGLQNLFVINSALTQRRSRVYLTALIVILWDVSPCRSTGHILRARPLPSRSPALWAATPAWRLAPAAPTPTSCSSS